MTNVISGIKMSHPFRVLGCSVRHSQGLPRRVAASSPWALIILPRWGLVSTCHIADVILGYKYLISLGIGIHVSNLERATLPTPW